MRPPRDDESLLGAAWRRLASRVVALTNRTRTDADLDDELKFHLEMETQHQMRMGLPRSEAMRLARTAFGSVELYRDEARDARGVRAVDNLLRDVRVSFRSLRRTPGFAAISILTVALGVGTTTAVFSLIDGTLLRPLPYPHANALVRVYERSAKYPTANFSGANFLDLERETKTLQSVAAFSSWPRTMLGGAEPVRSSTAGVTARFFDVLQVPPQQGRGFLPGEGREGSGKRFVISDRFWRTTLNARPDWRNVTLKADGDAGEIVGIMPPDFSYPTGVDVWIASSDDNPHRTAHNWSVIGRLANGKTADLSRAELDHLFAGLKAQLGKDTDAEGVTVRSLREALTFRVRTLSFVLLAAVLLVLMVACINLASANLARGETQQRELAVRASLGAGRMRLVSQLATEKILLCGIGGILAIGLAWLFIHVAATLGSETLPAFAPLRIDVRVMVFGLTIAIFTGLVTGIIPALRITGDLRASATNHGASGRKTAVRRPLIAAEIALATVLLIGAGLLLRSFRTMLAEDPGYDVHNVLLTDIVLPAVGYSDPVAHSADTVAIARFFTSALSRVRGLPGVQGAAVVNQVPLGNGGGSTSFMIDGETESKGNADYCVIDSAYFSTIGIRLIKGRSFTSHDRSGSEQVTVINRHMADTYWPNADPIGHRVRPPGMDAHSTLWLTVVGVVDNVRQYGLDQPVSEQLYVHYLQRPERLGDGTIVVRSQNPVALAAAVRTVVRDIDRNVLAETSSMQALLERSTAGRRFSMDVLAGFSGLALFLAAVGIYGVLAYAVVQRQREIGVRMALGATGRSVRRLIVNDAMRAVLPGLALGLAGAFVARRTITSLLYGIGPTDPVTFLAAPVVILCVSLAASFWPAARAARVDPIIAIKAE